MGYTAATAAVLYTGVKAVEAINDSALWKDAVEPPYSGADLGDDPTAQPADGFEWKGKGKPSSGKGNWVRGKRPNIERLNPDFDHLDPVGPHWDYRGPDFPKGIRLKPDGSWEHKN